jgi:hypothetical protein
MSSSRSVKGKNKVGTSKESDPLLKLVDNYEDGEFLSEDDDVGISGDLEENVLEKHSLGDGAFVRILKPTPHPSSNATGRAELAAKDTSCGFFKKDQAHLEAEFGKYLPKGFSIVVPSYSDRATEPPPGCQAFYEDQFSYGLRIPFIPLIKKILNSFSLCPSQLYPHSIAYLVAFNVLMEANNEEASFSNFWQVFGITWGKGSNIGFASVVPRSKKFFLTEVSSEKSKGWKRRFFFVKGPNVPVSEGSSRTRPYRWDGATSWSYGQRKIKEKLRTRLSDTFLGQLQSDPYRTMSLVQEGVLRLAGLSSCVYPILPIEPTGPSSTGPSVGSTSGLVDHLSSLAPLSLSILLNSVL